MSDYSASISNSIIYYAKYDNNHTTEPYINRSEAHKAADYISMTNQDKVTVQELTVSLVRLSHKGVHAHPSYDKIYILGEEVLHKFDPHSEIRKRALAKLSPEEISALGLDMKKVL